MPSTSLSSVSENITGLRDRMLFLSGIRSRFLNEKKQVEVGLEKKQKEQLVIEKASEVLKSLSDTLLKENIRKVEALITWGLRTVLFDRKLSVSIKLAESRGVLGAEIITRDDEFDIEGNVLESFGGGVVQVESFLLRVLFLLKLGLRRTLFLDEVFSNVSEEYLPQLSKLLKELCDKLGIDLIVVTHNQLLSEHANKVYEAVQGDGELKLEKQQ